MLLIGAWALDGVGVQGSISDYYYTVMRNVFVGSMVANGVFFLSYRYARVDTALAALIGLAAIGVALFPTTPVHPDVRARSRSGTVHFVSATVFFLALAGYSFFIFTKTDPSTPMTPEKRQAQCPLPGQRHCSSWCAWPSSRWSTSCRPAPIDDLQPVFWLETVASVSFGLSWLVKGETLLKDAS